MATRKAKPKAKPSRKSTARRLAPKAKKAPAQAARAKLAAPERVPKWSTAQKSEFGAIQARAKALGANLRKTDFDDDGNPLPGSPWSAVLGDLDAWARKYKVKFATRDHEHAGKMAAGEPAIEQTPAGGNAPAGATPLTFGGSCPGSFSETSKRKFVGVTQIRTTSCTLRRRTWLGRCVYDCVETVDWV